MLLYIQANRKQFLRKLTKWIRQFQYYEYIASVVQWQNARLPRGRPGFDSRPMQFFFFLCIHYIKYTTGDFDCFGHNILTVNNEQNSDYFPYVNIYKKRQLFLQWQKYREMLKVKELGNISCFMSNRNFELMVNVIMYKQNVIYICLIHFRLSLSKY